MYKRKTLWTLEEVQRKWKHMWWGFMDCDRCPTRTGMAPCLTCARLKDKMDELNRKITT